MSDFASPRDIGTGGKVIYGTDDGVLAEFYFKNVLLEALSKDIGHPIYEDRIYLRCVYPGNTKTVYDQPAKGITYQTTVDEEKGEFHTEWTTLEQLENGDKTDPERFPKAWERFTKKGTKASIGWDIAEWPAVTRSMAESLKAQNIPTVEALASLSDQAASNVMGGLKWRNLAKAALDKATELSMLSAEQEKVTKAQEETKELKEQIKALQNQVAALTDKKNKAA